MGTMESLKFLVSSKYVRDLATLVVAYGISINLVEVTWKSKLKAQVNIKGQDFSTLSFWMFANWFSNKKHDKETSFSCYNFIRIFAPNARN